MPTVEKLAGCAASVTTDEWNEVLVDDLVSACPNITREARALNGDAGHAIYPCMKRCWTSQQVGRFRWAINLRLKPGKRMSKHHTRSEGAQR